MPMEALCSSRQTEERTWAGRGRAAAALVAVLLLAPTLLCAAYSPPNFVVILADDLGERGAALDIAGAPASVVHQERSDQERGGGSKRQQNLSVSISSGTLLAVLSSCSYLQALRLCTPRPAQTIC